MLHILYKRLSYKTRLRFTNPATNPFAFGGNMSASKPFEEYQNSYRPEKLIDTMCIIRLYTSWSRPTY